MALIEQKGPRFLKTLQICVSGIWGGLEKQLYYLCKGLVKEGHIVHLITPPNQRLAKMLMEQDIRIFEWPFSKVFPKIIFLKKLKPLIHKHKYDIVHIHSSYEKKLTELTLGIKLLGKSKIFVSKINNLLIRRKWVYKKLADHCIAVSLAAKDCLMEAGVPKKKVSVIYTGIDPLEILPKHDPHGEKLNLREKINFSDRSFIIGSVGRLEEEKGHKTLIQCLPLLLKKIPGTQIFIAGEGKERRYLERLCRDLHIKEKVHFVGFQGDVVNFLSQLDIFVLPSKVEGLPNVLLEALWLEIPIVASNVGGVSEVISHGENGLLVPPNNIEELAQSINFMFKNKKFSENLSKPGKSLIQEKFGLEKMIKATEQVCYNISKNMQ